MRSDLGWVDFAVVGGASIFLLLGGFFFLKGGANLWRSYASESWPTADGEVVASGTQASAEYDSEEHTHSTMYSSHIAFKYTAFGHEYTTNIRHFGQLEGSGDSSEVELDRFRYPANARVTVSYNPADPSIAAAEPGPNTDALWLPGAGLAFAVPAVMFIVLWFGISRGNRGFGIGLGIFAGIFTTIGAIMLTAALTNVWRAIACGSWPRTSGVIVYGKVDRSESATHSSDGTSVSTSSGTHIVFKYGVGGKTYFSNIRRFGQLAAGDDEVALRVASSYPVGRKVEVFYSPKNPKVAALEPGLAGECYWFPGAGAAFFLFGLAVFIWGIPALTSGPPGF